jgi:hypothetical protein
MLEDRWPRRLLAALAVQDRRPAVPELVAAVRAALEDVVMPALAVAGLTWRTSLITRADDLERRAPAAHAGLDWPTALADDLFESLYIEGLLADRALVPHDPLRSPVHALARLPTTGTGPATLAVSCHEWVFEGAAISRPVTQSMNAWVLTTAQRLDAETAYIALDYSDAWDPSSAWEQAVQAAPAHRDVTATIWGYGWATMLSAVHVVAVGGRDVLAAVPGVRLLEGPGGRLWVRLGDDPAGVTREQIAVLRQVLEPVLPTGDRSLLDYQASRHDPFADPPPPHLL